jgi:hypothetical protein
MNYKVDDATNKIMLAFLEVGIVPLDVHQYALIDAHVRSILSRAMETEREKPQRKWAGLNAPERKRLSPHRQ